MRRKVLVSGRGDRITPGIMGTQEQKYMYLKVEDKVGSALHSLLRVASYHAMNLLEHEDPLLRAARTLSAAALATST